MVKPDNCSWCNSQELELHKNFPVFNPDTNEEDIIDEVYKCKECKTLFVDNKDITFTQREIKSDKLLQMHDDCKII